MTSVFPPAIHIVWPCSHNLITDVLSILSPVIYVHLRYVSWYQQYKLKYLKRPYVTWFVYICICTWKTLFNLVNFAGYENKLLLICKQKKIIISSLLIYEQNSFFCFCIDSVHIRSFYIYLADVRAWQIFLTLTGFSHNKIKIFTCLWSSGKKYLCRSISMTKYE